MPEENFEGELEDSMLELRKVRKRKVYVLRGGVKVEVEE